MSEIHTLPGAAITPEVLLHQALANHPDTKAVMLVVMDQEDCVQVLWSTMKVSELCLMKTVVDHCVTQQAMGVADE